MPCAPTISGDFSSTWALPTIDARESPSNTNGRIPFRAVLGGAGSGCDRFRSCRPIPLRSRVAHYPIRDRPVLGSRGHDMPVPERHATNPAESDVRSMNPRSDSGRTATGRHGFHICPDRSVSSRPGRKSLRDNIFDNSHGIGKQADNRLVRLPGRCPRPAQVSRPEKSWKVVIPTHTQSRNIA